MGDLLGNVVKFYEDASIFGKNAIIKEIKFFLILTSNVPLFFFVWDKIFCQIFWRIIEHTYEILQDFIQRNMKVNVTGKSAFHDKLVSIVEMFFQSGWST